MDDAETMEVRRTRFRVAGMDCASCATKIQTAVGRIPGVEEVGVSVSAGTMTVSHGSQVLPAAITRIVDALGYKVTGREDADRPADTPQPGAIRDRHPHEHGDQAHAHAHAHTDAHAPDLADRPWWQDGKTRLTAACGLALAFAYLAGHLVPAFERWAFVAALAVGLVPIARRAIVAARYGTPFSIEMLMTIAAIGAVLIGATEEAAAVVLLFLVGELLEGVAAGRARASIRGLTALLPKTALVERNGRAETVPAETVAVGAVVLVRPGDRVPADGTIAEGESSLNEAPVTGESVPKRKAKGDLVFAGTINGGGVLRIRVTAAAQDNTIARVIRLVEDAQASKAPTERFIDRFARYYTPGVVAVAALVACLPPLLAGGAWSEWIYKGLAILLIGCPCALVISTPAAIAAGLSAGARRGLLLKGGAVLETLGRTTLVAFDKTGTLTLGKPVVTDGIPLAHGEREVLSLAAALETGSSHPLALAVLAKAQEARAPVPPVGDAVALGGKGVAASVGGMPVYLGSPASAAGRVALDSDQRARIGALTDDGKTVSVLLAGGEVAGLIAFRDEPRPDARAGIQALAHRGIETVMVTGDNAQAAAAIAGALGLPARAELLPEDKLRIVREFQGAGRIVAKLGDGINDAPALAAADIGIAMGDGTDVALETADAAILHGRVADVARLIDLSRRTMANIKANIAIALGLKAVFLVTTIAGVTGLWPAILADTGATVLVTANALRLLQVRLAP